MADVLYKLSTRVVWIDRLYDNVLKKYVNDATITMDVYLKGGAEAVEADISFNYVTASEGKYYGVIPHTVTLIAGSTYTLKITIVSGASQRYIEVEAVCQVDDG